MVSDVRSLSVYNVNVDFGARLRQRQIETWICAAEGAAGAPTGAGTPPSDNSCGSLRDCDRYQCTVRLAKATLHLQSWPHHMGTVGASHQPQIQEWREGMRVKVSKMVHARVLRATVYLPSDVLSHRAHACHSCCGREVSRHASTTMHHRIGVLAGT